MTETVPSPELLGALWCLQARAIETDWFSDPYAARWYAELLGDHHYTVPAMGPEFNTALLSRVISFDYALAGALASRPAYTPILNLGCGFCTRMQRTNQRTSWWYQLDLPEVIRLRRAVHRPWPLERHMEIDLAQPHLFYEVAEPMHEQPVIVAEGFLSILERNAAERLLWQLRNRFGHATIIGTAMRSQQAELANIFFLKYKIRQHWSLENEDELERGFGLKLQRTWSIAQLANRFGGNLSDPEAGFMFQATL